MKSEIKICECCGQKMMIYRRNIRKCMLFCLRKLFFKHGTNYVKAYEVDTDVLMLSDFQKLQYWRLIEAGDGCTWRITPLGIDFIMGRIQIKKYVFVYNQELQSEPEGEINPLIWCWQIAPQEISKEIVLSDAVQYPRVENDQLAWFK